MVNGYGFDPFQGMASHELWSFDLKTKSWSLLPTIGDAAGVDARSIKVLGQNEIIVMAYQGVYFGSRKRTLLYKLSIINGVGVWKKIKIVASSKSEVDGANRFLQRNSKLSSLVYSNKNNKYYSVCSISDCDIFEITIRGLVATILVKEVQG